MIGKLAAAATALVLAAGLSGCIIIDSDGGERTVVSPAEMSTSVPPSHSARTTLTIASRLAAKARDAVEADVIRNAVEARFRVAQAARV